MTVKVLDRQLVLEEASEILFQQMDRSKVALLLSSWYGGGEDYLKLRAQLFDQETVSTLAEKIRLYQTMGRKEQ